MFSSSRWIPGGRTLALAFSFAIAAEPLAGQAVAQDTAHKKSTMQMPMNMPMGKKTQKKKPTSRPVKQQGPGAGRSTAKAGKKPVPSSAAAKKVGPRKMEPMGV